LVRLDPGQILASMVAFESTDDDGKDIEGQEVNEALQQTQVEFMEGDEEMKNEEEPVEHKPTVKTK
jgi:hypothetical protein